MDRERFEIQKVRPERLQGEFEVGDRARQWTRIGVVEELIAVALKQGIVLDAEEADTILGYLEGHDYCLMADDQGMIARHDEQYGDNHRGDEPYTVRGAIEFCQEMNEELLHVSRFQSGGYLTQLRKDEQVLGAMMERIAISVSGE